MWIIHLHYNRAKGKKQKEKRCVNEGQVVGKSLFGCLHIILAN
jgi:hypothetical protein